MEQLGNGAANVRERKPFPLQRLLVSAFAGLAVYLITRVVYRFVPPVPASAGVPWIFKPLLRFDVQATLFVIVTFLAIYRRNQKDAGNFAFLSGMGVAYIAAHWLTWTR